MAPPNRVGTGNQRQILLQHQTSTEDVMGETPDIVTFFVADRLQRSHAGVMPAELHVENISVNDEIASCLRQVGDDLENNQALNDLIGQIRVTPDTAFPTFSNVAKQIFADGVYNWGRVVTLLYFGYKLACSVMTQVPLVKLVLEWVVRFVKEKLVNWIARQGGWVSELSVPRCPSLT